MKITLALGSKQEKTQEILLQDILGTGTEYIWKELNKISDISSESTEEILVYNLPNINENENYLIEGRKFNWTKLYGTLSEGEYEFILSDDNSLAVRVTFKISKDGKVVYDTPSF